MSFFQNVFDFEFRPTLFGADRQYQMGWKLPANTNRSDYMLSGNSGPFNLYANSLFTINYAYDINFVNYSTLSISVAGVNPEKTTTQEIVTLLNSNEIFSSLFLAVVYQSTNRPQSAEKILIKGLKSRGSFRAYVPNIDAERMLQFNKNAPIRELPKLFTRYTIANRFAYPNLGADRIVELDHEDPYESSLISAAGFDPENPKPDWQLMQGVNDAFWFYNKSYDDDGKLIAEIKYPAGAKAGDLAKKTYYNYSGDNITGVMETPHVLQQSDIMSLSVKIPDPINHLFSWGVNGYGQLGNADTSTTSSPAETIAAGTNWSAVSCGQYHTAAIKTDGTLWTWGRNSYGELGIDDMSDNKSSPIQTITFGTTWSAVSCGGSHTAAIKKDGTLWTWGNNDYGELGDNTTDNKSSPIQTITFGTTWSKVSCGYYHTAGIKKDGTLWTWGRNSYGGLGDNTTNDKSSPVQVGTTWSSVSCGYYHTTAIKFDGTLWTWGANAYGQLGDGTTTYRSSPVQTIAAGNNWKNVSCGEYHTLALKSDNSLWTWGGNSYGQLGDSTTIDNSSPVQIGTGTDWSRIACGNNHTASIKKDGTLWTWGRNYGSLGDNTTDDKSSPIQTISQGFTWNSVDAGGFFTVALKY